MGSTDPSATLQVRQRLGAECLAISFPDPSVWEWDWNLSCSRSCCWLLFVHCPLRVKQLVERERRECEQRCHAAMVIQRWYCWQKAGQAQRSDYVRVRKAALTLQAVWRGVLARRNARVCGREGGGGRVCWMGGRKEGRGCREEGWWRWRG